MLGGLTELCCVVKMPKTRGHSSTRPLVCSRQQECARLAVCKTSVVPRPLSQAPDALAVTMHVSHKRPSSQG